MNTVIAKSYLHIIDEKLANGTIVPGMLVKRISTDKVVVHATAGGPAQALFAVEDENQGRGIDTNYVAGELVKLWIPTRGDQVNAIADDTTSGGPIVIGDFLESAGDGRLRKATDNSAQGSSGPIAIALEAITITGGTQRILVEVL